MQLMDQEAHMNTEAVIDGTKYTVKQINVEETLREDMKRRGWDGNAYHLTGPRGATFYGMRSKHGEWNLTRLSRVRS